MAVKTYEQANAILAASLPGTGSAAMTPPASGWCALASAEPVPSLDTWQEIHTPGTVNYNRQTVTFAAPSMGARSANVVVTFSNPAGGTVWTGATHLVIVDSQAGAPGIGSNILRYGPIPGGPIVVQPGTSLSFPIGNIVATEA